jgi:uncharacterized delta-60 repeat protein
MRHIRRFTPIVLLGVMSIYFTAQAQDYALDQNFAPAFGGRTHPIYDFNNAVAIQPDQKIVVGGNFTTANGDPSVLIARLNPNGTRDTSFNSPLGAQQFDQVETIKLLPDGKMYVSGTFRVGGVQKNLVRLNADGSLDNSFVPATQGTAYAIALYSDGRILACGNVSVPSTDANLVVRLNANGSLDASFAPHMLGGICYGVAILPNEHVYASGTIASANGQGIPGLIKFNPDGTRDTSFTLPSTGFPVTSREHFRLALQPDGRLVVAAKTWYYDPPGDYAVRHLVRYNPDGSYQTINNCAEGEKYTFIYPQSDGKLFTNACSPPSGFNYMFARLQPDGSFDTALNRLDFGAFYIYAVDRQANGDYIAVGAFTEVNGVARQRIARLVANVAPARHQFDFDGDGRDDVSVFRPSDRYWYLNQSTAGFGFVQWGFATDKLIAADYDNDGKTDVGVFRDGTWYVLLSATNTLSVRTFGQAGDVPLVGDLNDDGAVDMVIRHQMPNNTIQWQIRYFGSSTTNFTQTIPGELPTDRPLLGDFDGDGSDEIAYFRNGDWHTQRIGVSTTKVYHFGSAGDVPVAGDYDHDGQADYAVFRPADGNWYLNLTTTGFRALHFGATGDVPVPADYDGDGKTDIGVFRNGVWYQLRSSDGTFRGEAWGLAGDIPIPAQ